jgi:hypothetical protein
VKGGRNRKIWCLLCLTPPTFIQTSTQSGNSEIFAPLSPFFLLLIYKPNKIGRKREIEFSFVFPTGETNTFGIQGEVNKGFSLIAIWHGLWNVLVIMFRLVNKEYSFLYDPCKKQCHGAMIHAIPFQTIDVENYKHHHQGHQWWHLAAR